MQAVFFNTSPNKRALAGSIALHALIAAWFLWSLMPVEIMPQQMIQVRLIAAPSGEPVKNQPITKIQTPLPKSERAMQKVKPVPEKLSALSSAAGQTANTMETAQMVTTKPLFDAVYLNNPAPEYPANAKRRNMEGMVMLDVAVSTAGTAHSVRIAESSGFSLLDESAKNAVSSWKFVPAKRGGEIVEARVIVPIEFRLE